MTDRGPRVRRVPPGDDRSRLVCPECEFVAYENPKLVVGVVATWQGRYLLCKRAIAPRTGYWTLPAGFMELGESPLEGALREAREEARAEIVSDGLLAVYSIGRIGQVQMFFRGELVDGAYAAGVESLDAKLVEWSDIPWDELAFPTVKWALRHHREVLDQELGAPFVNDTDPPPLPAE